MIVDFIDYFENLVENFLLIVKSIIFVYLLIVYDLDYFVDSLFNYYKIVKSETKVNVHLSNLLDNKIEYHDIPSIILYISKLYIRYFYINKIYVITLLLDFYLK